MVAAAERGVDVRFLFDHLGLTRHPRLQGVRRAAARDADPLGADAADRPLKGEVRRPDLRNHRKILVVDGRVGFMGSQNLIEPGYDKPKNHKAGREWVELMTRVTGPVVRQLNVVFATDWYAETGEDVSHTLEPVAPVTPAPGAVSDVACQVVPSGPGFATENNLRLFNSMVYRARRRLSLTSPYFVPDESMLYAVTTAAQRGVEVELFVSAEADQFMVAHAQRSYYLALLEAGVRIWLYPSPFVLHAKHFTVDEDLCRDRLLEHGLPLVRAELRGGDDADQLGRRTTVAGGAGRVPVALARAHPRGVARNAVAGRGTSTTSCV